MDYFLSGILLTLFFFGLPALLTVYNIRKFAGDLSETKDDPVIDMLIMGLGFYFCSIVVSVGTYSKVSDSLDWFSPAYEGYLHAFLHTEYKFSVNILIFAGFIGFLLLCTKNPQETPPLISAIAVSLVGIGCTVGLFIIIQLMANFDIVYIYPVVYWINAVIISARRIRRQIISHVNYVNEKQTVYRNRIAFRLAEIMSKISTMTKFCFLMIIPVAVILEIIFILIGQGADGAIKAFTETPDWTFSQQIPPPSIERTYPDGHYLCTVATGGHRKVVKPLRYGKRCGNIIIVNRQLLTANAFEDLIAEKAPNFHHAVRTFYNKHGYPLSKHITTKLRADIVYIVMKPLEWIFLIVLYLFDSHPENRIAVQYSDYKKGETKS